MYYLRAGLGMFVSAVGSDCLVIRLFRTLQRWTVLVYSPIGLCAGCDMTVFFRLCGLCRLELRHMRKMS